MEILIDVFFFFSPQVKSQTKFCFCILLHCSDSLFDKEYFGFCLSQRLFVCSHLEQVSRQFSIFFSC